MDILPTFANQFRPDERFDMSVNAALRATVPGESFDAVIAHPGMDTGWVSSAVRMARMTAVWLAFAVLTTERNAA